MTASAWAQFQEAAAMAARQGDKREKVARERAAKLEPKLARIVVTVTAPAPDLDLERDGKDVPSATLGSEIPVDPGKHVFTAKAPGKKRWEAAVDVPASGGVVKVVVPALEAEAPEPAPPVVAAPAEGAAAKDVVAIDTTRPGNAQKSWSYVAAGVGIAAVGGSIGMGLAAKSKFDDAKKNHCNGGDICDATGLEERKSATGLANAATVVGIAGGALVAAGVVLFLTAPKAERAGIGWVPVVGPSEAGVFAVGSF